MAHILVAEQRRVQRDAVRQVLEGAGHRVSEALQAREVLLYWAPDSPVALEPPDLLVLGPRLPDMAPAELVEVLRQRYLDVPVVLLVEGADAVATAPVVVPELLDRVARLLAEQDRT